MREALRQQKVRFIRNRRTVKYIVKFQRLYLPDLVAFMTQQDHVFADWIIFGAYEEDSYIVAQIQMLFRPNDFAYEIGYHLGVLDIHPASTPNLPEPEFTLPDSKNTNNNARSTAITIITINRINAGRIARSLLSTALPTAPPAYHLKPFTCDMQHYSR